LRRFSPPPMQAMARCDGLSDDGRGWWRRTYNSGGYTACSSGAALDASRTDAVVFSRSADAWVEARMAAPVYRGHVTVEFELAGALHRKSLSPNSDNLRQVLQRTGAAAGGATRGVQQRLGRICCCEIAEQPAKDPDAEEAEPAGTEEIETSIVVEASIAIAGPSGALPTPPDDGDEDEVSSVGEYDPDTGKISFRRILPDRPPPSLPVTEVLAPEMGKTRQERRRERANSCRELLQDALKHIANLQSINDKGPWLSGMPLPGGVHYYGELQDGTPHGQGRMVWPDGREYFGSFSKGCRMSGTMCWSDGRMYCGQWVGGLPHGVGTCSEKEGDTWRGEWANGEPQIAANDQSAGETSIAGEGTVARIRVWG